MFRLPIHKFTTTRKVSAITTLASLFASTTTPMEPQTNALPRSLYPKEITYTSSDLARQDESPDTTWYRSPRFVQHIDDGAIAALRAYYATQIKDADSIVDVCSSWTSHLPETLKASRIVGYGMNAAEMKANKHLTSYYVKDLNTTPSLQEVEDSSMDVVLCNVSVDYLNQPVEVFKEMGRVLKKGGTAHMAFSDRCFPTKVVHRWLKMSDEERRKWVGGYFWASEMFEHVEDIVLREGGFGQDPLYVIRGVRC
ncbi:hypothetical protein BP5796_11680 [Coleophoma crateriformis]|uniref:Methyltransferase type 11 domain-containing protein n=1 Tax=Coleophoma crateriformis TaxID=565419 RepID=A0A3D8QF77_9HELO|nr:hypothetical protein BP5796_11680 [Coleophoma crateriformis]